MFREYRWRRAGLAKEGHAWRPVNLSPFVFAMDHESRLINPHAKQAGRKKLKPFSTKSPLTHSPTAGTAL